MLDTEIVDELQQQISEILNDEVLADIPLTAEVQELEALLDVEKGQAYNITIQRPPLSPIGVIVRQSSTVQDIKRLLKLQLGRTETISWKYIWRSYCLMFGAMPLLDDRAVVSQLGIQQNSVLTFSRRAHEKGQHRKAWRRRSRA